MWFWLLMELFFQWVAIGSDVTHWIYIVETGERLERETVDSDCR